jgi:hypothetical protein
MRKNGMRALILIALALGFIFGRKSAAVRYPSTEN